jgi:ketosteroid isomerase-like protein
MSQENVEIVRASIDAYNQGDWDAALKDVAPGCEFDLSRATGPRRGVHSLDQMRRFLDEFGGFEAFESVRVEADEYIDAGEHVVVPLTLHARGRDGIEVEARPTNVWTIRDGAIVRVCLYQERNDALEAAGLRSTGMSRENVEVVRRALAFFGGLGGHIEPDEIAERLPDAALEEFLDPEAELVPISQGLLGGNRYKGYEGIRRFWADFFSAWDEFRADPQEFLEAGAQVVVVLRMSARMHELEIDEIWSQLWTLRNGRVVRLQAFANAEGALEAAGLSE